jgi:hypothetical protein
MEDQLTKVQENSSLNRNYLKLKNDNISSNKQQYQWFIWFLVHRKKSETIKLKVAKIWKHDEKHNCEKAYNDQMII